ncbi:MAG: hypothetical protein A2V64_09515 [Bacteroidetes bacterium RBG_13_43_22]|nr:MAG: hypothetical protein A2V64_09515 [Bacteroidetes bacterium RBG_13_43_22]
MKNIFSFVIFLFIIADVYAQNVNIYQTGITAQQNLNAIANLAPYSTGGIGFDTRYEGVVGSPRLFGTLLTSYLLVNDKDFYIKLETDIDLAGNAVLYTDPETKKLFALPADNVNELIIVKEDKEMIFKTTKGLKFEKNLKETKFYQVLAAGPVSFIKIPDKLFVEADYKGAYSADRRFDEYQDITKYFITGSGNIFHQIQLNRKSLIKLFPDKKELINKTLQKKASDNNEELVISLIEKF